MKGVMVSLPHRAGVTSNTALLAFWSTRLTSLNNGEVGPEVGPQELRRGFQMLLAEKNAPLKVTLILVVRFAVVWSAVMEVTVPRLNTRYLNVFVIPGSQEVQGDDTSPNLDDLRHKYFQSDHLGSFFHNFGDD